MAVNTTVEVVMPPMGDSVSEGSILEWHKQEGDEVSEDETLVEISTDKVDAEVPAPVTGTVVKIHAAEGDTVGVGSVLAEIAPGDERRRRPRRRRRAEASRRGRTAARRPSSRSRCPRWASRSPRARSSSGPSSPATRSPRTRRSSRSPPTRWTPRSPRRAPGTLTEMLADAGDTVTVGQVIARMTSGQRRRAARRPRRKPEPTETRPGRATPRRSQHARRPEGHAGRAARRRRAGHRPRARSQGTGPNGRIGKADVLALPGERRRAAAAARRRRPAASRRCSRARARCSRATWTSRGRSRPRPRSAPSPSPTLDALPQAAQGAPARRSPSRT